MARSLAGAVHHLKRTMTQRTRTREAFFSFCAKNGKSDFTHKEVSKRMHGRAMDAPAVVSVHAMAVFACSETD